MFRFLTTRLSWGLFVMVVVATLTFLGLHALPGGPFDIEAERSPEVRRNLERKFGLQEPLGVQYFKYLQSLASGNLGSSYYSEGRPITHILSEALPVSLTLGGWALLIALGLGIPLGAFAGSAEGRGRDIWVRGLAMAGVSLPTFLLGPVLILVFSAGWPWNVVAPSLHAWLQDGNWLLPSGLMLSPKSFFLPVMTLALRPMAFVIRLTRASVVNLMREDFVQTARAKGLRRGPILFFHVLKGALPAVLAYAGPLVAGLLSGSFVVEIIFALPGIAKYFVQSVFQRDYPMVMALTLVFTFLLVVSNILADGVHRSLDPRVGEPR